MNTSFQFVRRALALAALAMGLAAPLTLSASTEIYLKVDGIPGESTAVGFEDYIRIYAFSWGASNATSSTVGSGLAAGKPDLQDLAISKSFDSTSPLFFLRTVTGQVIPKAKLQVVRVSDAGRQAYLTLELDNVTVTSVQFSHSEGGGDPVESITLAFTKVKIIHTNSAGGQTSESWNLAKGK